MSSQIVKQVQSAIDTGKLVDGDRLPSERDLAEQFSVSRVTVRDALRALEALGLVTIRVGAFGGAFISVPDADVVGRGLNNLLKMSSVPAHDVAEARLGIELAVVALVCSRRTDDDLAALEALCEEQEAEIDEGIVSGRIGPRFHMRLAGATQNRAMLLMAESFRGPLSMSAIRSSVATVETSRLTLKRHRELIAAIRDRDVHAAQHIMAEHLLRGIASPAAARRLADEFRGNYA